MWRNLGQVIAEYPHLESLAKTEVSIEGLDRLTSLKEDGKPAIFFSIHSGNWELASASFLRHGLVLEPVYRPPNNPWADRMLNRFRSLNGKVTCFPKSPTGTRKLVKALKDGHHVGILIDQKYNEGLSIPFFGTPAMTSPAFVQLAQKFKCPLIPTYALRHETGSFTIHIDEELDIFNPDGSPIPVEDVINAAHSYIEKRIKETPSQWLWLHRRWGKNV